ncbi:MAG: glycosyl hydrolase, partial [Solimonas sp.]
MCLLLLSAAGCTQPAATITSPGHTIFDNGGATLTLTSPEGSFTWTATDINGMPVGNGSVTSSPGSLTLPAVGPGWYGLSMKAPSGATLSSAFSVVANAGTPNTATPNPFGSNMHPQTPLTDAIATAEIGAIGAGGLASMRIDVRWELVEKTQGVFTWYPPAEKQIPALLSAGIRPLIVLGYANPLYDWGRTPSTPAGIAAYAAYAAAVAQHYGPNVDYAVFNEFNVASTNNSACGITADCYYALLGPTATAIRAAAPGARVVGPSLGGFTQDWIGTAPTAYTWLKRLLDLGGLAYVDAVDIHNYTWPVVAPPEGNNEAVITAVRSLMASYSGGASKPLWLTETGWPTFPNVVNELTEAQYVVRDAALALRAGIAQYMFYDVMDDCADAGNSNGQCHFGLLRHPDVSGGAVVPKPAFTAYAVVARKLAGYSYAGSDNWGSGVYALAFASGGATRRVAWAPAGNVTLALQS